MKESTVAKTDPEAPLEIAGGLELPRVGLGTWELTGGRAVRVVAAALEMGYRHVDTAEAYGNEAKVGHGLTAADVDRDDVFLTSKVFRDHLEEDDVERALDASLSRLQTDYLDLYLIHWPNAEIPVEETVGALEAQREEGKIRAWGVSNFTPAHLDEMLEHGRPAVNQVEVHPYLAQEELMAACGERDVPVIAYSPLARGAVADDGVLADIAADHGKTPAQIALRWSLQKGRAVIPKASGAGHLGQNLDVFNVELDTDEMARIDGLDEGRRIIDPGWAEFDR